MQRRRCRFESWPTLKELNTERERGNEEAEGATPSKGPASAEDAREDDEGRKKKKEV